MTGYVVRHNPFFFWIKESIAKPAYMYPEGSVRQPWEILNVIDKSSPYRYSFEKYAASNSYHIQTIFLILHHSTLLEDLTYFSKWCKSCHSFMTNKLCPIPTPKVPYAKGKVTLIQRQLEDFRLFNPANSGPSLIMRGITFYIPQWRSNNLFSLDYLLILLWF